MKVVSNGISYDLSFAECVEYDGEDLHVWVGWDHSDQANRHTILSGERAKRAWDVYTADALNLDNEFPHEPVDPKNDPVEAFKGQRTASK